MATIVKTIATDEVRFLVLPMNPPFDLGPSLVDKPLHSMMEGLLGG